MNILKKTIILGTVIFTLGFTGCQNAVGDSSPSLSPETTKTEQVTVFVYKGGSEPVAVQLNKGSTLSSVNTDYVIPGTHHFLYWSTSRANSTAALKGRVDLDEPITQNMILYGIYAPVISSTNPVYNSNNNTIKIYYDTNNLFVYNNNTNECELNLFTIIKDENGENIIKTAHFNTPFLSILLDSENIGGVKKYYAEFGLTIPSLPAGDYQISITNLFETIDAVDSVTSNPAKITVLEGKAAATVTTPITVDDSYAKISWSPVLGSTYTVNAKIGGVTVATRTECHNSAEFYGLTNDASYTFEIITEGTEYKTLVPGTPKITQQTPEWVLAMYMDGDNDLHDYLFQDLNEVEYGLWKISQDTTNYSANAVKAVALWDGWTGNNTKTPYWQTGSDSYLFEIGPEESTAEDQGNGSWVGNQIWGDTASEYLVFNNLSISSTTKNLSYTARDWLLNNQDISTITENSSGEVNMGDRQTLINYINWVKARYKPSRGIILQFSDHGGGPRNGPNYAILPNGTSVNLDQSGRKALCWDEGSDDDFLKTQDVSYALDVTGFKSIASEKLILMDVCLGGSIEDAYQFKDYADYMVASPSTIPGYGMNYIRLMQAFIKDTSMKSIGKQIISDYAKFYEHYGWDSMAKKAYNKTYSQLDKNQKKDLDKKWAGFFGVSTLSLIDLSQINDVAEKIYALTDILNNLDTATYNNYLTGLRKDNVSLIEQYYNNTSLTYKGSYNFLYDIGRLTDAIKMDIYTDPSDTNYDINLANVYNAATEIQDKLKAAIVSSWRDTRLQTSTNTNSASMYSYLESSDGTTQAASYDFADNYYGLTMAGYAYLTDDNNRYVAPGRLMQWYVDDLAFGNNQKWIRFLLKIQDLQTTSE